MQAVIEVAKVAIITVREAGNLTNNARLIHTVPRSSGQMLRQPTFDWKASDK